MQPNVEIYKKNVKLFIYLIRRCACSFIFHLNSYSYIIFELLIFIYLNTRTYFDESFREWNLDESS